MAIDLKLNLLHSNERFKNSYLQTENYQDFERVQAPDIDTGVKYSYITLQQWS